MKAFIGLCLMGYTIAHKDNDRYINRETSDSIKSSTSRWTPYDDNDNHPFGHLTKEEMR